MRSLVFFVLILSLSCSGVQRAKKLQAYIVSQNHQVTLGDKRDSLEIHYTGCGGFYIQQGASAIMLDPYFSNLSPLLGILIKRLKSDTTRIDNFFSTVFNDPVDHQGFIKAILVAHSHYDHLADVPAVYQRNCNSDSTQIIASKTTHHLLAGAGIHETTQILAPYGRNTAPKDKDQFISQNGRIKITPIVAEHAPHFAGKKLLSTKKITKDFEKFPRKAKKMPEGESYNFLIDFFDETGKITFRIFSHAGSACNAEVGFPPTKLLGKKKVDVLLLCAASFSQVKGYPQVLIDTIKPRHIILNHWENFFRPREKLEQKPATVPRTNIGKFINELEQIKSHPFNFTLPQPGTRIVLYY